MKLDIRRKVLLLVLSGSLLTFLLINVFLYFGLYRIRETVETKNEELGEETAEYTEQLVEAQIKKRMGEITRLRSQCLICRRSCRPAFYSLQSGSCQAGRFAGFTA